ncbi:MAG TPA: sigma factor-like helix-turn-helix DNA-binding protein [Kofleriaceae bacterium]|nr:sigma factor-like helix-turn-helix DNA-binding protein [Kofleriaceae bacterium]
MIRPGIEQMWHDARAAWPGVDVALEPFAAFIERHLAPLADPDQVLPSLFAADLYLACACAAGDRAALKTFEDQVLPQADAALRRVDPSPTFADEVRQILRQKLFVGDGESAPKIGDYAGRGPLATWVRVAAVRTALNLRGSGRREMPMTSSQVAALAPAVDDAGLKYLKGRFADEFEASLARACGQLSERDRTILRLRYADDLNIDQIGALYGVHRATVARWIGRIRDEVYEGTRKDLIGRLKLDDSDFEALLRLAHSQIDVSLSAVLTSQRSG